MEQQYRTKSTTLTTVSCTTDPDLQVFSQDLGLLRPCLGLRPAIFDMLGALLRSPK